MEQPLADRLRPQTLEEVVGQRHLLSSGSVLRRFIENGANANMIFYAYEECVDRTGKMSMPYMDKIITSWHKNGVKTPLDIAEERKRWQESQKKASGKKEKEKPQHEQREPSYDIDRFMQKSVDLVYDKNDKNA